MPPKKRKTNEDSAWLKHDIYKTGVGTSRTATRSQTAFARVKSNDSDLELFEDGRRHHPPKKRHLIATMKGEYGAIPRTILTRSTVEFLAENDELYQALQDYKEYTPPKTEEDSTRAQGTGSIPAGTAAKSAAPGSSGVGADTPPAILGEKGPSLSQPHVTVIPPKDVEPGIEKNNGPLKQVPLTVIPPYIESSGADTPPAILEEKGPSLSQPHMTVIPPKDVEPGIEKSDRPLKQEPLANIPPHEDLDEHDF